MAPEQLEKARPIFGKFSPPLKIGIVGTTNVGKSTLFYSFTEGVVNIQRHLFSTVDVGRERTHDILDEDERLQSLVHFDKVLGFCWMTDVPGLVKKSHQGFGMGNNFLSDIRGVDVIFHVLRAFKDPFIPNHEKSMDPVRDLRIVTEELRLKDIEFIKIRIKDIKLNKKWNDHKQFEKELELCREVKNWLRDGKDVRLRSWEAADIEILDTFQLLTAKPVVYLANMKHHYVSYKFLPEIKQWVNTKGDEPVTCFRGDFEELIARSSEEKAKWHCKEQKEEFDKIIATGLAAANVIFFYAVEENKVVRLQSRRQTKVRQAAGAFCPDFEKKFTAAEVMKLEDLKNHTSWSAAKGAGNCRKVSEDYEVEEFDAIHFLCSYESEGERSRVVKETLITFST